MGSESIIQIRTNNLTPIWLLLIILGLVMSFWLAPATSWILTVCSIFLLIISLLYLLYTGPTIIRFDTQGVEVRFIFGKYSMDWDEMEKIKFVSDQLIMEGYGKILTIPGYSYWGDKREEVKKQIETLSGLSIQKGTTRFLLQLPKFRNTKG